MVLIKYSQNVNFANSLAEANRKLTNKQDADTAINTSNIGTQSVNYAAIAGNVAWNNVQGRPSLANAVTTVTTETKQVTIAASSLLTIELPYATPSGYIPLGIIALNANTASSAITRYIINGSNVRVELRNITAGQQTLTISAVVLMKYNN